jgi:hypothetical protein
MNMDLEEHLKPETRASSALGRVVALTFGGRGSSPGNGRAFWWSNRPGQDRGETFTIAVLITLTVSSLAAGWIMACGGGWAAIALLILPAFFAIMHGLIFAAVLMDVLLRCLGIENDLPPGHFCGRLFLGLLSAVCALVLIRPESACWLRLAAGAWCAVAAMNAAAWFGLTMRDLFRELARER